MPDPGSSLSVLFTGDLGLTPACLEQESLFDDGLIELFASADVVCVNLELPFTGDDCRMAPYTHPSLRSRPESAACLAGLRPGVVNIATNHCMDGGRQGIALTRSTILGMGALPAGAGASEKEAREPAILEMKGLRIGFLGYCKRGAFTAEGDRAGAALLSEANLREDIPKALEKCDILAVSLHMGMEFSKRVHPSDRRLARLCIELGASCVVGHHPHVIQGMETWMGRPVFYSLGNLLFDNNAGAVLFKGHWEDRHRSFMARVVFQQGDVVHEIIPVVYTSSPLRAGMAGPEEASGIRNEIESLSAGMDSDDAASVETEAVGAIARREIATIIALTRAHGLRFVLYFLGSIRMRHIAMAVRALAGRILGR